MLTESERHWAINAKMRMSHKNDFRCGKCGVQCYVPYAPCFCVMSKDDFAWEIEFLSRVAAKLAGVIDKTLRNRDFTLYQDCTRVCPAYLTCAYLRNHLGFDCAPYLLKWARLAVEEEMSNEAN